MLPLSGQAVPVPELWGSGFALAYGGSVGPSFDQHLSPASAGNTVPFDLAYPSLGYPSLDGSYADSNGLSSFGLLSGYADAHRTYNTNLGPSLPIVGDAQAKATTQMFDYFVPTTSAGTAPLDYTLTLTVDGTHTPNPNDIGGGRASGTFVYYKITDFSTNSVITYGSWSSTDAVPTATLTPLFQVLPAQVHDYIGIEVDLEVSAYAMSNNLRPEYLTSVANYSMGVHLDAVTAGASTDGLSGHEYASPPAVPEPPSWALIAGGLAFITMFRRGAARRCRR